MLDSLGGSDGSVSAAAQCWLVRALSLNDVIRVLEPILLLLLCPNTQRCSIQNVKQNLTAGQCGLVKGAVKGVLKALLKALLNVLLKALLKAILKVLLKVC